MKQNLFTYVPESECYEQQGKPYTLKSIDKMKGEKSRSRLVAREIKRNKSREEQLEASDVFSAMPPTEALKAL
eukprot:6462016-Amphidinium_carterae.1